MTVEVARPRADGARIQATHLLVPEGLPTRPLRREELMDITTADQLRPHLYRLVEQRFPPKEANLGKKAYEIVARQFDGEFRRNGNEAVVHPGGVAYWDLLNNPDISIVRFGIDLFHDNEEDLGLTAKDNYDLLTMADFQDLDARLIAFGSFALSRKENGGKLSNAEYNNKMVTIHGFAESLDLMEIKPIDTWYNTEDYNNELSNDPTNMELAKRAYEYIRDEGEDGPRGKAAEVLALATTYARGKTNTRLLREAMDRCMRTVMSVYTPPTARVPV